MKFFWKKTGEKDSGSPEMQDNGPENGGKKFTPKRIVIGVISAVFLLWVISTVIGLFMPSKSADLPTDELDSHKSQTELSDHVSDSAEDEDHATEDSHMASSQGAKGFSAGSNESHAITPQHEADSDSHDTIPGGTKEAITHTLETEHHKTGETVPHDTAPAPEAEEHKIEEEAHSAHGPAAPAAMRDRRPGIATTEAIINVLEHELRGRWWGWRSNDVIQITDNVQNYQLGVLEVTRRAVVTLAERMSRTGSTALYDPNLEMAMNWIMVKAESYWFPSAESKYKETIEDLRGYATRLETGSASFFTRADNLIPLLASFEDLLGSCDEILLKAKEDDGSKVSFFKTDNYFYYTKGVIESMLKILEAVREDFHKTLDTRRSLEIMDHALHSLEHGEHIRPWIVLDSSLGSIFANHRSNLAGPVSHARFHLGLLIKALST